MAYEFLEASVCFLGGRRILCRLLRWPQRVARAAGRTDLLGEREGRQRFRNGAKKERRNCARSDKDDFSISESGRPQTIRYFSRESDLPLTLGLAVDTSMSQQRVLDNERGASFGFLDRVLREDKDKVFLMQFDLAVLIRQPLTSSRKDLEEALSYVDTPTRRELPFSAVAVHSCTTRS